VPYLEHFRNEPYCKVVELHVNFRGQLAQHADNLNW
jgi:phosphate starvation-inducible protein PhoH and related proteins